MNAERRPAGNRAASEKVTATTSRVRRIGPFCGCERGGRWHDCGLYDGPRLAPCWECSQHSLEWLAWAGRVYGGCPHRLRGAA